MLKNTELYGGGRVGHRPPLPWQGVVPAPPSGQDPASLDAAAACQFNQSIISRVASFAVQQVRGKKSRWGVQGREAPPLACCCALCSRARRLCARMHGRIALLSQGVAVMQVCGSMWQPASVVPLMM